MMDGRSIKHFQTAVHLWLLLFMLSALPSTEWLWVQPVSPSLPVPGKLGWVTHCIGTSGNGSLAMVAVIALLVFTVYNLIRPVNWWSALVVWFLYTNVMNVAWMAGSGGQQLIANVLFWNIFLSVHSEERKVVHGLGLMAFWIIRIQLLLAYFVSGVFKLQGDTWLEGTALGIAATDPAFGPGWITAVPILGMLITWVVLFFEFALPIAVWFRKTRLPVLVFGVIFHVFTALFMGIPDMAFAFIAVYPIWLSDEESAWACSWKFLNVRA